MSKPMPANWKLESEAANNLKNNMPAAALKSVVTLGDMFDFIGMLVDANKALTDRVSELQQTVKNLSAQQLKYVGVWSQEKVYGSGNFVTHSGSCFHAQRASVGETPGAGNDAWVLAVKKGKDAK